MEISFKTKKLKKQFSVDKELQRVYGKAVATRIQARMSVLRNAPTLNDVPNLPPERCHQLNTKLQGVFSVDVGDKQRLLFVPNHDPMPVTQDGGIDSTQIRSITILEIQDTHKGKNRR